MPTLIALLIFVMSSSLQAAPDIPYQLLHKRPHPHQAFTQGLLIHGDQIVESSGLYRQSYVQRYPVQAGSGAQVKHQPRRDFSEGLAFTGQNYWLLTWQQGLARKLDTELKPLTIARYDGEGWGLTFDGQYLVMSDGSNRLTWRDPGTFQPLRTLSVSYKGEALSALNELEYANGFIWANVWFDKAIYAIDPATGNTLARVDLTALAAGETQSADAVLNGIAFDPRDQTFWVTGKRWKYIYQLKIPPFSANAN